MFGLTKIEMRDLRTLTTPARIQDFLDAFPVNLEKNGGTYMSPRRVLAEQKMHCFEGALVAALAFWIRGGRPLLLDLKTHGDVDHVVALYRVRGYWGAVSKTNHATLRFRDPVYRTLRELGLSYFHEYFNDTTGRKVLRSCSARPFDLRRFGTSWVTSAENLQPLADAIDQAPHQQLVAKANIRHLRRADAMERRAGDLREWHTADPRT